MIKANELRIGNILVFDERYEVRLSGAYIMEGEGMVEWEKVKDDEISGGSPIHQFQPIPLTPEWLERCGFEKEKDESNDHYLSYAIQKMTGSIAKAEDGWYFQITDLDGYHEQLIGRKIDFVHHLQNFYFALTGEELQIKMP